LRVVVSRFLPNIDKSNFSGVVKSNYRPYNSLSKLNFEKFQ
jgi:hypothetical protein